MDRNSLLDAFRTALEHKKEKKEEIKERFSKLGMNVKVTQL